eukprot:m.26377 g.26377  ORF g.26377 m.26377 type:complete len:75 (+) comp10029_c0_seq1:282-506(+)
MRFDSRNVCLACLSSLDLFVSLCLCLFVNTPFILLFLVFRFCRSLRARSNPNYQAHMMSCALLHLLQACVDIYS